MAAHGDGRPAGHAGACVHRPRQGLKQAVGYGLRGIGWLANDRVAGDASVPSGRKPQVCELLTSRIQINRRLPTSSPDRGSRAGRPPGIEIGNRNPGYGDEMLLFNIPDLCHDSLSRQTRAAPMALPTSQFSGNVTVVASRSATLGRKWRAAAPMPMSGIFSENSTPRTG